MYEESECTDCPLGQYCPDRGATSPAGDCDAGHICYSNAIISDGVYNLDPADNKTIITFGDLCHPGYYCPKGTTFMHLCPLGTYNPVQGASAEADCLPCDPGKYCNDSAITAVSGRTLHSN